MSTTTEELAQQVNGQAPSRVYHPQQGIGDVDPNHGRWIPYDGSDPQPGDVYEFTINGKKSEYRFQGGDEWDPTLTPSVSQGAPSVHNFGTAAQPDWRQYNQDTKKWEPVEGLSNPSAGVNPATKAKADAALAKYRAGGKLTTGEVANIKLAYPNGLPGQSQYVMPVAGYTGKLEPHHAGNANGAVDIPVSSGTPVQAMTSGTIVMSKNYGTAGPTVVIRGNDGRLIMYQHLDVNALPQVGTAVTPGEVISKVGPVYPGENSTGPHLHVAISDSGMGGFETQHGTSTGFDTLDFLNSVEQGKPLPSTSDLSGMFGGPPSPKIETISPGTRIAMIDPTTGQPTVTYTAPLNVSVQTHGQNVYTVDPNTGKMTFVGQMAPTAAELKDIQSLTPKAITAWQQAASSIDYASNEFKNGNMTADQLSNYTQLVWQNYRASMMGKTVWQMYTDQQAEQRQRAQIAKDLLDTKLTQSQETARSILGDVTSMLDAGKYRAMDLAPGTLYDVYQGALSSANAQAKPLSDAAKILMSSSGAAAVPAAVANTVGAAAASGIDPHTDILAKLFGPQANTLRTDAQGADPVQAYLAAHGMDIGQPNQQAA